MMIKNRMYRKRNPSIRIRQYFTISDSTFIFDDKDVPEFQDPSDLPEDEARLI